MLLVQHLAVSLRISMTTWWRSPSISLQYWGVPFIILCVKSSAPYRHGLGPSRHTAVFQNERHQLPIVDPPLSFSMCFVCGYGYWLVSSHRSSGMSALGWSPVMSISILSRKTGSDMLILSKKYKAVHLAQHEETLVTKCISYEGLFIIGCVFLLPYP